MTQGGGDISRYFRSCFQGFPKSSLARNLIVWKCLRNQDGIAWVEFPRVCGATKSCMFYNLTPRLAAYRALDVDGPMSGFLSF